MFLHNPFRAILLTFLIVITFISCKINHIEPQLESKECPILADCVEDGCTYCDVCGDSIAIKGSSLVYEAITRNIDNVCYEWTVLNGDLSIVGSNLNSSVIVKFNNEFTSGELQMYARELCSDSLIICSTSLYINSR